jgi:hypothetical protein
MSLGSRGGGDAGGAAFCGDSAARSLDRTAWSAGDATDLTLPNASKKDSCREASRRHWVQNARWQATARLVASGVDPTA